MQRYEIETKETETIHIVTTILAPNLEAAEEYASVIGAGFPVAVRLVEGKGD